MRNKLEDLPFAPGKLFIVDNYLKAAGVISAMRAGVDIRSVRRPLLATPVRGSLSPRSGKPRPPARITAARGPCLRPEKAATTKYGSTHPPQPALPLATRGRAYYHWGSAPPPAASAAWSLPARRGASLALLLPRSALAPAVIGFNTTSRQPFPPGAGVALMSYRATCRKSSRSFLRRPGGTCPGMFQSGSQGPGR